MTGDEQSSPTSQRLCFHVRAGQVIRELVSISIKAGVHCPFFMQQKAGSTGTELGSDASEAVFG